MNIVNRGQATIILYAPGEKKVYHGTVDEIVDGRILFLEEAQINGGPEMAMSLPLAWCVILWGQSRNE